MVCKNVTELTGYLAGKSRDFVQSATDLDIQASMSSFLPKALGVTNILAAAISHSISFPVGILGMMMGSPSVIATVFTSDMSWLTSWSPNRNLELLSGALFAGVNALDNAANYGKDILGKVYDNLDASPVDGKSTDIHKFAKETGFLLFSCKEGNFNAKDALMKYGEKLDKDIKTLEKRKKGLNKNTDNYEEESKRLNDKLKSLKEKKNGYSKIESDTAGLGSYTGAVNNKSHLVKNESAKKCLMEQMKSNFLSSPSDTGNFFASFIVDMTKRKIKSRDKSAKQDNGSEQGREGSAVKLTRG